MPESKVISIARVDAQVIDRARNYVAATAGETLCGVISRALRAEIERLEREGGGRFDPRDDLTGTEKS